MEQNIFFKWWQNYLVFISTIHINWFNNDQIDKSIKLWCFAGMSEASIKNPSEGTTYQISICNIEI